LHESRRPCDRVEWRQGAITARRLAWESSIESEPRVVQLGWESFDANGQRTGAQCDVIRPDGFDIPADAERIHDISTERANRIGVPIAGVLEGFAKALNDASLLVAHNWDYDAPHSQRRVPPHRNSGPFPR
jgi:DNA polymerase III epsilon subunit-like protein